MGQAQVTEAPAFAALGFDGFIYIYNYKGQQLKYHRFSHSYSSFASGVAVSPFTKKGQQANNNNFSADTAPMVVLCYSSSETEQRADIYDFITDSFTPVFGANQQTFASNSYLRVDPTPISPTRFIIYVNSEELRIVDVKPQLEASNSYRSVKTETVKTFNFSSKASSRQLSCNSNSTYFALLNDNRYLIAPQDEEDHQLYQLWDLTAVPAPTIVAHNIRLYEKQDSDDMAASISVLHGEETSQQQQKQQPTKLLLCYNNPTNASEPPASIATLELDNKSTTKQTKKIKLSKEHGRTPTLLNDNHSLFYAWGVQWGIYDLNTGKSQEYNWDNSGTYFTRITHFESSQQQEQQKDNKQQPTTRGIVVCDSGEQSIVRVDLATKEYKVSHSLNFHNSTNTVINDHGPHLLLNDKCKVVVTYQKGGFLNFSPRPPVHTANIWLIDLITNGFIEAQHMTCAISALIKL